MYVYTYLYALYAYIYTEIQTNVHAFTRTHFAINAPTYTRTRKLKHTYRQTYIFTYVHTSIERWGAGVETQKNVRGEIEGWGRVPFNETYAPLLSTIYDGA